MNFERVPEHEMLRDSVRQFFERELPETRIREMDRARRIPRDIWKRFAALGWQGLSVPTEFGGSGADVSTAAALKNASETENALSTSRSRCSIRHGLRGVTNGTTKRTASGIQTHGALTMRPKAPG